MCICIMRVGTGPLAALLAGVRCIVRTKHNVTEPGRKPGKTRSFVGSVLAVDSYEDRRSIEGHCSTDTDAVRDLQWRRYWLFLNRKRWPRTCVYHVLAELGVHGSPVVGIVGRLTKQKGHETLLRAIADVAVEWPNVILLIAGDGEERKRLEQLTDKLGVRRWVRYLGAVNNVREFLGILDLFVHPSLWEGLGISVLEAMAMARPVVATNVDGLTEIINNGVDGLLVNSNDPGELANAMTKVLQDRELALRLGIRARKRVIETFSPACYDTGL